MTWPGDYNADGEVSAADYKVYRNALAGIGGTTLINEGVTPGVVTIEDYAFWKTHYGESINNGSSRADAAANVPEPASYVMILVSIAILAAADRRRERLFPDLVRYP